ncbi:hypothetical protein [Glutamicibacter sp. V16R2B1]|uniref:hypothetical protein n=1 Tax=Glutamicibacter sp. V16R2B1 TaxID=2036207 RepID=UPI0010FD7ADD|nr:hypothetical protein [Glutamicibacter sp. V16R2B1]MCK9901319.1 hypothetical protein [Frankia sp. Cpl3]TLK46233.1 hypothetical protein FDN03_16335 [Glutamicibacter sp. V16R2B1]
MARVQQARGTGGEVTPLIRALLAIYRAVPLRMERQLRARALLEDRPVADLVVEALGCYLSEPEQQKAPPPGEGDGAEEKEG